MFLIAARQVSRKPDSLLFGSAERFPRYMDTQIPLSEAAQHFYTFGMPNTLNYFPARFAGLIDRYWVLFLGIVSVGYTLIQLFLEVGSHLSRLRHKPIWERLSHIRRTISQGEAEGFPPSVIASYRSDVEAIYDRLTKDADAIEDDAQYMLLVAECEKILDRIVVLQKMESSTQ